MSIRNERITSEALVKNRICFFRSPPWGLVVGQSCTGSEEKGQEDQVQSISLFIVSPFIKRIAVLKNPETDVLNPPFASSSLPFPERA